MDIIEELDEENKSIKLAMACNHNSDDYDGEAICDAEYNLAIDRMSYGEAFELAAPNKPISDRHFLTNIVIWLNWEFNAYIDGILNDMWSGIYIKWGYGESEWRIRCECDSIEEGLARIFNFLYEFNQAFGIK